RPVQARRLPEHQPEELPCASPLTARVVLSRAGLGCARCGLALLALIRPTTPNSIGDTMVKKQSARASNPFQASLSPDDLSPANRLAFEIFAERRDLLPSIERILNAGLDDTTAATALGFDGKPFRSRTSDPGGDQCVDPRVAIRWATETESRGT
ncbi:MAG TPA: hypothetical protein PLV68_02970, partial [Ilumatobacteraceae bacterium]|nr:hypothetical protein [Ilumatobacteraceae bacterium]